jgi:hypothetical protein
VRAVPTVIVRVEVFDPVLLVAVNVTVLEPAVVNAWLGFCDDEVVPSPKLHCHEVGDPVEVSVNWMD